MFGFLKKKYKYEETHEPEMDVAQDDEEIKGLVTVATEPTDDGSSGDVSVDESQSLGYSHNTCECYEWIEEKIESTRKLKDGTEKKVFKATYSCPKCGKKSAVKTNYCSNCGAKLRKIESE